MVFTKLNFSKSIAEILNSLNILSHLLTNDMSGTIIIWEIFEKEFAIEIFFIPDELNAVRSNIHKESSAIILYTLFFIFQASFVQKIELMHKRRHSLWLWTPFWDLPCLNVEIVLFQVFSNNIFKEGWFENTPSESLNVSFKYVKIIVQCRYGFQSSKPFKKI